MKQDNFFFKRTAIRYTIIHLVALVITFGPYGHIFAGSSRYFTQDHDKLPCSALEYYTDSQFFRATGTGTDENPRLAERMARLEANAQLSANIGISVQSVTSRYLYEQGQRSNIVYVNAVEHITSQTTERHLRNVQIACRHTSFEHGRYVVYLAVKVASEDVLCEMEEEFENNSAINHLYDKGVLRELFTEEMEALEESDDP